jgi:hypothetical protein
MCGIVGMIGDLHKSDWSLMRHLLFMNTTRGVHSTGLFYVGSDCEVKMEKSQGAPGNLYEDESSDIWDWEGKVLPNAPVPKIIVGHNRFATKGKINSENAHPFNVGDWFGVHNGSLERYRHLSKTLHEVDSKYIIDGCNQSGFTSTWESMRGAAAVVAYDQKKDLLHIARNEERPLVFAKLRGEKAWIFASEAWMIHALYMKEGTSSLYTRPECTMFDKNKLYTVKVGKGGCETTTSPLRNNVEKYSFYSGGGSGFGNNKSHKGGNLASVRVTELLKKQSNSGWALNTSGWKEASSRHNINLGDHLDIELIVKSTTSLSPWVMQMHQKTLRHLAFTVKAGHKLEGVPVFVYLDDKKSWLKMHENTGDLKNPEVMVRFNSRPRLVIGERNQVIAIHCSIRSIWLDPIKKKEEKEEMFKCYMCEGDYSTDKRVDLPAPDIGGIVHDVCKGCATTLGYYVEEEKTSTHSTRSNVLQ